MHTVLRNFINTLHRFRLATTLNLVGLALAFASFIVILIQTQHDLGFDRFHPKVDRIYRVEVSSDGVQYNVLVGRKWTELIKGRFPQIELTGLRMNYSPIGNFLKVDREGSLVGFNEDINLVHPDFAEIFDFQMVEGEREALARPGNIILPKSVAERLFGDGNALDKTIILGDTTMTVGGVYRDFPRNTLVRNIIYYGINPHVWGGWDGWSYNYELFLTLREGVDKGEAEQLLKDMIAQSPDVPQWVRDYKIRLTSLPDIYYATDMQFDGSPKGSRTKTSLLLLVSLLIVFIASFNYVNFSVSLVPLRINNINIQKVLGCEISTLRMMMVFEGVGICLIAFMISLAGVWWLESSRLSTYLDAGIDLWSHIDIVFIALLIALAVGAIAGLYPAFYATKFAPALVLKGSFGLSPKGRMLRTLLISFQYIVSIGLIIAALVMHLQNRYLQTRDTGYDTSHVAVMKLNDGITSNSERLIAELKRDPRITNVAFSQFLFGTGDTQQHSLEVNGERVQYAYIVVTSDFLRLMGIHVSEGRDYLISDEKKKEDMLIANKSFLQVTGFELGHSVFDEDPIIGVVDNINFRPLRFDSEEPLCFSVWGTGRGVEMDWCYVRFEGDPYACADHIKRSISAIDPTFPFDVRFYDSVFDSVYQTELKLTSLISLFSLLAISISLGGILGLIFLEAQYRRREIGVRKVYGSSVMAIIRMFNLKYIRIICGCFLVAAPIAWWGVEEWLKEFAFRIPMHWWIFAVAFIVVVVITAFIVTVQSWQIANENPVRSIKLE